MTNRNQLLISLTPKSGPLSLKLFPLIYGFLAQACTGLRLPCQDLIRALGRTGMDGRQPPTFDEWHQAMTNDDRRTELVETAIRNVKPDGKTIFEIGTGEAFPAITFAQYGASHVYSCEMNAQLAASAEVIVRMSGFSDRITIWPMSSGEVIQRGLLKNRDVDIIFTETLSCDVLSEGFHLIASDIRQIARHNTKIMPGRIEQYGCLIQSVDAWKKARFPSRLRGIDFRPLQNICPRFVPLRQEECRIEPLSCPRLLRLYDYRDAYSGETDTYTELPVSRSGTCHGLLTYFRAYFGSVVISNGPELSRCPHWTFAYHPLMMPLELEIGSVALARQSPQGWVSIERTD
jgi:type I protein arginine methyltransferase